MNNSALVGGALLAGIILVFFLVFYMSDKTVERKSTQTSTTTDMIVAGGCFWCVEADMEKVPGVIDVISGYSGGDTENPTYETYADGSHREVVRVIYDPGRVTYRQLLYYFLKHIDPTDGEGQFVDRGVQYAPAMYVENNTQRQIANDVLEQIQQEGGFDQLQVPVYERQRFWPAEEYHQDYYKEHSVKYQYYRYRSGRDTFIEKHWSNSDELPDARDGELKERAGDDMAQWEQFEKPDDSTLKQQLTDIQYKVTQQDGTEPAYDNVYWDEHREGIYVDVVSGEPLFSSLDKYESGTGWPSFTKPLEPDNIVFTDDWGLLGKRTEVRSKHADSHLGHVFNDGPTTKADAGHAEPTGKRYCLNSAALRFIPKEQLVENGYGDYATLFEEESL